MTVAHCTNQVSDFHWTIQQVILKLLQKTMKFSRLATMSNLRDAEKKV